MAENLNLLANTCFFESRKNKLKAIEGLLSRLACNGINYFKYYANPNSNISMIIILMGPALPAYSFLEKFFACYISGDLSIYIAYEQIEIRLFLNCLDSDKYPLVFCIDFNAKEQNCAILCGRFLEMGIENRDKIVKLIDINLSSKAIFEHKNKNRIIVIAQKIVTVTSVDNMLEIGSLYRKYNL